MSAVFLLDDQPVRSRADRLHFQRYLSVIERYVLNRESIAPFVVGIYGPWGSGKSSLKNMLAEKLSPVLESGAASPAAQIWEVVEFSPWMYRNEKSLLLPLLATLAKNRPVFRKLVNSIVKSGPGLIKMLSQMSVETASAGLPLLAFLGTLRKEGEKAKDLQESIREAVAQITGETRRIVFLIDDLDRCHDPAQVVGLLEQIKLFLHLDRCVFFLFVDREQIIKYIEDQFPGQGAHYLEKFVQLGIELAPHQSHHVASIPSIEDPELSALMIRIAEVLEGNPRRLKQL